MHSPRCMAKRAGFSKKPFISGSPCKPKSSVEIRPCISPEMPWAFVWLGYEAPSPHSFPNDCQEPNLICVGNLRVAIQALRQVTAGANNSASSPLRVAGISEEKAASRTGKSPIPMNPPPVTKV